MLQFNTDFSPRKKEDMGFQLAWVNKEYMPIPLKVTFSKKLLGYDPFLTPEFFTPETFNEKECYVMAARDETNEYSLFVKYPDSEDRAYAFSTFTGSISLVFEAEKFLYIMENASKQNKLILFRHAVLPNITEANKFLALVENSTALSPKDHNRAWTWIEQMAKGRNI